MRAAALRLAGQLSNPKKRLPRACKRIRPCLSMPRWFFCYAKTYRGTADRSKPNPTLLQKRPQTLLVVGGFLGVPPPTGRPPNPPPRFFFYGGVGAGGVFFITQKMAGPGGEAKHNPPPHKKTPEILLDCGRFLVPPAEIEPTQYRHRRFFVIWNVWPVCFSHTFYACLSIL